MKEKKLFDHYFLGFWERLNEKKKLTEEHKSAYEKKLFRIYSNLCKVLDHEESIIYTFNVPSLVINHYERDKLRKSRPVTEYFLKVIDYYLENDVSEYFACNHIFDKYGLHSIYEEEINFRNTFRKWYKKTSKNKYPKITDYIREKENRKHKNDRKNKNKNIKVNFSDKPFK